MHVFIDTNILLNFFHFAKDELDALTDVFASHEEGAATVHLTQQVQDEFRRNREIKIKDAMRRFKDVKYSAQLPSFMKGYEEYEAIQKLSGELQKLVKAISDKVDEDVIEKRLLADQLISDIFGRAKIIPTTPERFDAAHMRVTIGNPPGKSGSYGDAINWIVLLETVPDKEPLHLISADGDFYSALNEEQPNPFLKEEWEQRKRSQLRVYRTLSAFMSEHFDGVAFSFDKEKDALIDELATSGSFAGTHLIISKLEAFRYFSQKEVERILSAAKENDQFGWIVTDQDVSDFLNRIAVPRRGNLSTAEDLAILDKVIEEQRERTRHD
ncbi:hypothetical protein PLCT2_03040 [Planctomycetaceae bacterium]|nr:hypothetical protein PLCT2_03040 [Planctomycetaceae bacterium]